MATTSFTSIGFGNGFPFMLDSKCSRMKTQSINQNKNVVVNNFWNLKRVELVFTIETTQFPDIYATGWIEDEEVSSSDDVIVDRVGTLPANEVKYEYDVVSTLTDGEYPPQDRNFPIKPGEEVQDLDEDGFIVGSGKDYTSFAVTNEVDFYMPFTIQPQNSGAFVITSDSDVANYYASESVFGNGTMRSFYVTQKIDLGTGADGASDIQELDQKQWYIVPRKDWDFSVSGAH